MWRTNRPLIATVSDAGVVTGVSDGEATITVVSQADTTLRATARVRVVPIVRNLSVSPTAASLNIGQTRSFVARAEIDQGASDALTWSSDNAAIATVNAQGVATAIGVGSTVIRVRSVADTTREATATLTVVPRPVTLTLGTRALGLLRGAQSTVSAVVSADPGVTTAVQWTSRNTAVASVDGAGRVIAVNAGETYVIAEAIADARSSRLAAGHRCSAARRIVVGRSTRRPAHRRHRVPLGTHHDACLRCQLARRCLPMGRHDVDPFGVGQSVQHSLRGGARCGRRCRNRGGCRWCDCAV
jgi:uncharacterized protein YjdB